ncbi:MAG TPA: DUF4202 domain-containing protein [Polyangiaceae bacterium]|nr:DUF4202 domain-containing protein [Polyangiaceae bacterium]
MDDVRFSHAVAAFDRISTEDPALDAAGRPKELVQKEHLVRWVLALRPAPSDALLLAAHCQHVGRHKTPRSSYPEGRAGYLRWRTESSRRHADIAEGVLAQEGFEPDLIRRVRAIVEKRNLGRDEEVQVMEDALCLAFLETEFAEFAERHEDDKLLVILRKTWKKMSEEARQRALQLPFSGRAATLLTQALTPESSPPA